MGLRIKTNVESLVAQRGLSNSNNELSNSFEKLSTGLRINRSADDAAGLAISENLRAKVRGLNQAKRNANDGVSLVQVAESGLSEMGNILIRMRELTLQAGSDTVGEREKSYIQKEFDQLSQEIDRIADTTEFNGLQLLRPNDKPDGIKVQVGYNGTESDQLTLRFGDSAEGIGAEALGVKNTNLVSSDRETVADNLENIDRGLETIASSRAVLGSLQSRLNAAISNISQGTETMAAASSRIRDVDFAEETARLTQNRILSQAGLAVLAQANQRPEMALSLLR
ncbi:MAG: flagellin FliC [Proteobacteria bacterium]|jgi:flagellin|nr:flagellin FliC [Pseudomonadota bacterium]